MFCAGEYKVISFDVFDTLLLRPFVDPQEVWKVLEEKEGAAGFAADRKRADAETYRRATERGGETSLEEAYELIPQWRHLMNKELELEKGVLRSNPEMLALWKEAGDSGAKRVIVSDMYQSRSFVESVLRENGVDGWDAFYLSSDRNARKTTGELFRIMLEEQGTAPEEVLHIGDNPRSDVAVPSGLGIKVRPYRKVSERFFEVCPFARHIDSRLAGALALGWHLYLCNHPDATYWNRLGFVMGGVLGYLYVSWIVETARKLGKKRLMFVARDGYVLRKICNALFPEVETGYFYAPRLTSIAVLGATGSDPAAIKDRQDYIDTCLQGVDRGKIGSDYREYLSRFEFDADTAMVDGCSSGFSAQRLVEKSVGRDVFCFYLLAMARMHSGAALYATNLYSMPFQMLSEFLFCAPERPATGVSASGPAFEKKVNGAEAFKISVSEEIADGAVACAVRLKELCVEVTADEWLGYADAFMSHLTKEDRVNLGKSKNAADVRQKKFSSVIWKPKQRFSVKHSGIIYTCLSVWTSKFRYEFVISAKSGFHYKRIDLSYRTGEIVE